MRHKNQKNKSEILDSAPPNDPAIETALLGCVLLKPELIVDLLAAGVCGEDFYDQENFEIWRAMTALHAKGTPPEIALVVPWLHENSAIDNPAAIAGNACRSVPTAANWRHYLERVRELQKRRLMRTLGEHLLVASANGQSTEAIINEAESVIHCATSRVKPECSASVVRLSDVTPEKVAWLWPQRIALGKLTFLVGDPGLGKSFLSLDLAARISLGSRWPDCPEQAPCGSVVLLSAEDDIADTIRPRMDAAGADSTRIRVLLSIKRNNPNHLYESPFDLGRDLPILGQLLDSLTDCKLLIIDPISAYCGQSDSHKNTEVRALLAPLADLAAKYRIAVVAVTHLRKGEGSAIYRTMGSMAFVAASRAAWAVVKDKGDEKRRLLIPIKNNLGDDQNGLAFRLTALHTNNVPQVEWDAEPITISADDALAPDRKPSGRPSDERDAAEQFLREELADGPRLAKEMEEEAVDGHCISIGTLKRARKSLGVVAWRPENPGPWYWRLPDDAQTQNGHLSEGFCDSALVPESDEKSEVLDLNGSTIAKFRETAIQSRLVHNDRDNGNRLI